jgi:hypothetical protein
VISSGNIGLVAIAVALAWKHGPDGLLAFGLLLFVVQLLVGLAAKKIADEKGRP